MASPRIRPTFTIPVHNGAKFQETLRAQLQAENSTCSGQVFRRHAVLMPNAKQQFWSPYLNVEVREEDNTTTVAGRFSPHPNVWTGFMAMYGLLTILGIVGLVLGLSQLTLHSFAWGFLLVPTAIVIGGFVYGAAFIGQGLGSDEMFELRSFVQTAAQRCNRPSEQSNPITPVAPQSPDTTP